MPVMGFDDERVRDDFDWAMRKYELDAEERFLRMRDYSHLELLRQREQWETAPEWAELKKTWEELAALLLARIDKCLKLFVEVVVEAFRPLLEVFGELAEAARREVERVWALIEGTGEESAGRYRGPRHYNCRCMPVERVDPVRAGRTRWWTRK